MLDLSAIEDKLGVMESDLLTQIEAFLSESEMGASYFGKASCGNSEVVERLRSGRRVWPETEIKIRAFILSRRSDQRGAA
jgi:hypothetical protein